MKERQEERNMRYDPERINQIKEQYPPGTRIELISMTDPYSPVPPGTKGEVRRVDDGGTLHMKWDNDRTLGVIPGEDQFTVLSCPEQEPTEEPCMTMGGQSL